MPWQLQEAKQRFSQMVQRALTEGPQVVTCHGEPLVVVLSAVEYRRLSGSQPDFKQFLLGGPDPSCVDLERTQELPRQVDL